MPVAKSYSNLKQLGVPYKDKGKAYVRVILDNGIEKVIRWYSDAEYARMYPEEKKDRTKDPYYKPQKYTLGFDKGYITIFKGVTKDNEWWFQQKDECRCTRWWGWYVPSTVAVPVDYPEGVQEVKLMWDPMGKEDEWLKEESVVYEHVRKTLAAASPKKSNVTSPQEKIGDRLEIVVKVIGKQTEKNERYHSKTHLYELQDQKGNLYKWKTSAKDWVIGTHHHIRGTVKEFDELSGEPCIVLTRCIEQK